MYIHDPTRVGYILKMYPRFSETFIVNEILAHEAAGLPVKIFSLRAPNDSRFHASYAAVQAPVTYVPLPERKSDLFWAALCRAGQTFPHLWSLVARTPDLAADDLYQAVHLAQLVRDHHITHLHAHFATVSTTVAWLVSRLTGIPYSFTAHAKDIFHESVQPAQLQRHLRDAAQVITVSDYNVAYLQEQYGEDAGFVHRIYNGLDLAHFPYQAPTMRPRRMVAVGRLVEKKGFADLITACALLVRRGCLFTCAIIGDGPLQEPLQAQIEQLGLTGHVRLLGPQPQDVVIRQVQEAAIFAAPCVIGEDGNRDGLPTVLLEAMALGTPCVSTNVTGIPEVLQHNRTGMMVPQHDPHALALALEHLLDDPGVRTRLAAAARRQIEEHFDIHRNAATIRHCWGMPTTEQQPAPALQQEAVS